MTTVQVTIPADPNTIAAKSLDDDDWVPYDLGDDVISGEPNTARLVLRRAPILIQMGLPERRVVRAPRRPHRDHVRHRRALRDAPQRRNLHPRWPHRDLRGSHPGGLPFESGSASRSCVQPRSLR